MMWSAFAPFEEAPYMRGLFAQQRRFVRDKARRKAALCGRRSGKTEAVARWLIDGANKVPGSVNVYAALSQRNARRIIWPTFRDLHTRFGAASGISLPNEQNLEVRFANGSHIWVTGCDDRADAEKLRGGKYYRTALDEAASWPAWIEEVVEDILGPALMDLRGELAIVGTPGFVPAGYFFDITAGHRSWPTHHWTCLDNPHIPGAEELARIKAESRWDDDHPTYRREYMGEWVHDTESIVYPFNIAKNAGTVPAGAKVLRVLSVDLGWTEEEPCAFMISASIPGMPECYIEKAWKESGLIVSHIAGKIEQVRREWKIDRIVVDEGALGKLIAEDLRRGHGIPCVAAEKTRKQATIHGVRGALLAGTIKVDTLQCQQLLAEWATCAWNDDKDDHDPRCPDDLSDATLYGWRHHQLYYNPEENPPKPGTPEANKAAKLAAQAKYLAGQKKNPIRPIGRM